MSAVKRGLYFEDFSYIFDRCGKMNVHVYSMELCYQSICRPFLGLNIVHPLCLAAVLGNFAGEVYMMNIRGPLQNVEVSA